MHLLSGVLYIKARSNIKYQDWNAKVNDIFKHKWNDDGKKHIWIHCASLGEYEQALPIIERLLDCEVVLTFFSPSGYNHVTILPIHVSKYFLPVDTVGNMDRLVAHLRPDLFIGVKYEFWWNLLGACQRSSIPIVYTNVALMTKPYFLKYSWSWFYQVFSRINVISTQDSNTAAMLVQSGLDKDRVIVSGDTRVLRVYRRRQLPSKDIHLHPYKYTTMIWASVSVEEIPFIQRGLASRPDINHLIVPHDVDPYTIAVFSKEFPQAIFFEQAHKEDKIVIVDKVGYLFDLYRGAAIAYVGGGFKGKVHNVLEAAVHGTQVVVGPKCGPFKEVNDLVQIGVLTQVRTLEDLQAFLHQHLSPIIPNDKLKAYFKDSSDGLEQLMKAVYNALA